MQNNIIKITSIDELSECLNVIHKAYEYRDKEMNLKIDEHRHTYMTMDELKNMYKDGIKMYKYCYSNKIIAFLSLKINFDSIKIKDIVVLPEYQNNGVGKELLDFSKIYAIENQKDKIILGFIYNNTKLKTWYEKNGFVLTETKEFPNNKVGYMEYRFEGVDPNE